MASTRIADCTPIAGEEADLFTLSMSFDDPCGGLIPGQSYLQATFTFQPSGTTETDETLLGAPNIIGSGSGTVEVPVCIAFGNDTSVNIEVSVINGSCIPSNELTVTINNPGVSQNSTPNAKLNP